MTHLSSSNGTKPQSWEIAFLLDSKKIIISWTLQKKSACSYQEDCCVLFPYSKRKFLCSLPSAGINVFRAGVGNTVGRAGMDRSALGSGRGCCALLPGFSSRKSLCN